MKRVLDYIEKKKQELSRSSFLSFIEDSSIEARERFAFVPCLAPFAMAFMDLNKYVIRDDGSEDPVQQMINVHSREEDEHWRMYVKDLRTLNMNTTMDLGSVLKMLWGKHCRHTRMLAYELTSLVTRHPDPRIRFLIVEAVEGTADVAFDAFCKAAEDFEAQTGKKLHYFGKTHDMMEANHTITSDAVEEMMTRHELSEAQLAEALDAVDEVYTLFQGMFDELLEYALWTGNFHRDMSGMGKWAEVSWSTATM
ncbi:hypothetical protein F0U62_25390 [Cystobacter fuscus]|uniref:hypothetical protein n=1 Tax=Cystobacter fuscus TaxID=43 RepID=UPI002B2B3FAA|nr:hypothetical protein F0U62_25390 [Cystobacter fuscus]